MKNLKPLFLFFLFLISVTPLKAQNVFEENFDDVSSLPAQGWILTNQSPIPLTNWNQGITEAFSSYEGAANSYVSVDPNSSNFGNISNWLISPAIILANGDVISFYSRDLADERADRLECRLSLNGTTTLIPSGGFNDLGDFTTLALNINPELSPTGYPSTWTRYSYIVSGLSGPTSCKIGFRYYINEGIPPIINGETIGVDSFRIERSNLGLTTFNSDNITAFPNPVHTVLTLQTEEKINAIHIYDVMGKKVNSLNISSKSIDVSELQDGLYFLEARTEHHKVLINKFIKE